MRKQLAIILITLIFFSCSNESIIKVSGELIGGVQDTLIFKNMITEDEFKVNVNDSGKFTNEFQGEYGYYNVRTQSLQVMPGIDVFLQSKKEIVLNFEIEDWLRKRQFNVLNSPENEYIKEFNKTRNDIRRKYNMRELEPLRFIVIVDSIFSIQKETLNQLIINNKKLDSNFIEVEQNRILYNCAFLKEDYALRNKSYAIPENFFDFRKQLNYNDENLLGVLMYYGMAVRRYIGNQTKMTLPEDGDYVLHHINTCLKYISNQEIMDYVLINEIELTLEYSTEFEKVYELFMANCASEHYREMATKRFQIYNNTKPGNPSPKFINYENYSGGTTSLDDLKGKYIYIDVWATWCGPCIAEIPSLKKLEKKYSNKNIEFVSISIDESKDHDKWKKMIEEKELKGIQLLSDKDWKSKFVQDFGINGIPRFIIIDTEGKLVNANAPRPSDPELEGILNSLLGL